MTGMDSVYISITGLELKGRRHFLRFWWHALRSMAQAKRADGNVSADARLINGVHHTRTVWRDEAAMRRFLVSGDHLKAMQAFAAIATGKTVGFNAHAVPDWDAVHRIWLSRGKPVA